MRFIIRAILTGLLIGAAFYFVPFGFPFFFLFLFIFFFFRFSFGRRWRRGGYGSCWHYPYDGGYHQDITPIDGFGGYSGRPSETDIKKVNIQ